MSLYMRIDEDFMRLTVRCLICKTPATIEIPESEWKEYQEGKKLIQHCLVSLSDSQRELIISQTCPTCWDNMFEKAKK